MTVCFRNKLTFTTSNEGNQKPKYLQNYVKRLDMEKHPFILDAVTSSGILKAKQKLGVTFNSDKLGGIDFTKFSKLSMCSAGAGWYNGLGFLLGTAHGHF